MNAIDFLKTFARLKKYKQLLKDYHIVQSMDGKSRWADNIMIERWFRSLKVEEIYPNEYANPRELRRAIARYINEYNTLRPHGALDNRTPASVYYASFSSGASEEMELASWSDISLFKSSR